MKELIKSALIIWLAGTWGGLVFIPLYFGIRLYENNRIILTGEIILAVFLTGLGLYWVIQDFKKVVR